LELERDALARALRQRRGRGARGVDACARLRDVAALARGAGERGLRADLLCRVLGLRLCGREQRLRLVVARVDERRLARVLVGRPVGRARGARKPGAGREQESGSAQGGSTFQTRAPSAETPGRSGARCDAEEEWSTQFRAATDPPPGPGRPRRAGARGERAL